MSTTNLTGPLEVGDPALSTLEKAPYRTPTDSRFVGQNTIKRTISGSTATSGIVLAVPNPEGMVVLVDRAMLYVRTASSGASTLDIGVAANATTSSDNLIDGRSGAVVGLYDNITDGGTNGKSRQLLQSGGYVTVTVASGNITGLVADVFVTYNLLTPGS
jgi:hypothetical protein